MGHVLRSNSTAKLLCHRSKAGHCIHEIYSVERIVTSNDYIKIIISNGPLGLAVGRELYKFSKLTKRINSLEFRPRQ